MKQVVARQLDRVFRVSPMLTLALVVVNLAVMLTDLLPVPAWTVAALIAAIGLSVVAFANWWAWSGMIAAMRDSGAYHDPMQTHKFTPRERVLIRCVLLAPDGMERLRVWERLGYIPAADYPEDLR